MLIYLLMAVVLALRPQGLFPVEARHDASRSASTVVAPAIVVALLLLAGWRWCRCVAQRSAQPFYVTLFTRIVIYRASPPSA